MSAPEEMTGEFPARGKLAVWPPGTRHQIIGYCDVHDWARGNVHDVFLAEADRFIVDALPGREALVERVKALGYPYPTGKPGALLGKCDPIYFVLQPAAPEGA